jgi:hypothetical protein
VSLFCTVLAVPFEGAISGILSFISVLGWIAGLVFLVMHW